MHNAFKVKPILAQKCEIHMHSTFFIISSLCNQHYIAVGEGKNSSKALAMKSRKDRFAQWMSKTWALLGLVAYCIFKYNYYTGKNFLT